MEVQKISAWIPMTQEAFEDGPYLRWQFKASMQSRMPQTDEERETGWRSFTAEGLTGQIAVGWRADEMAAEADAKREADMAACPYVECTCGHHEDI